MGGGEIDCPGSLWLEMMWVRVFGVKIVGIQLDLFETLYMR